MKTLGNGIEAGAEQDYVKATEALKQFYVGLGNFLCGAKTENSCFGVGTARILQHFNPNLRPHKAIRMRRTRRKPGRV